MKRRKDLAAILVGMSPMKSENESQEPEEKKYDPREGLMLASHELMSAVKTDNAHGVMRALKNFFEIYESMEDE